MRRFDTTYTDAMDMLVLVTVGLIEFDRPEQRIMIGLLRKLVQSCLELAVDEDEDKKTESSYTWEEKIESLVKLAKATGTFLHLLDDKDYDSHTYKKMRRNILEAYDEFCEWRHEEPYVVDEIKELLTKRIDKDEPGHLQDALRYLGSSLEAQDN